MNKMNKKGFTLIEMLVVIAIIAILVAIIIPTVTSATDKASAATNAANLRSVKAEVATAYLTNDTTKYSFSYDSNGKVTGATPVEGVSLPESKKCSKVKAGHTPSITYSSNDFVVTYDSVKIDDFAKFADGSSTAELGTGTDPE